MFEGIRKRGLHPVTAEMDLFLVQYSNGMQIARGKPPLGSFALFPGLGKHLPKVLRVLPPPTSDGVYDISPCLALTAVASCIKTPAPEDRIAAFLDCLYPVDKLNATQLDLVHSFAEDVFGKGYYSMLQKAGIRYMKRDRYSGAYKVIRDGKSYWFRIDFERSRNLRRLVSSERSRSPRRQGESRSSTHSQDLADTSDGNDAQ